MKKILSFCVVFILAGAAFAAVDSLLSGTYKLNKGTSWKYKTSNATTMTMAMSMGEQNMSNSGSAEFTVKVLDTNEKNHTLEVVYSAITDKRENQMTGETELDTKSALNIPFKVILKPDGDFEKIDAAKPVKYVLMTPQGNDDINAADRFEQFFLTLPAKGANVGDTWETPINRSPREGITVKGTAKSTLKSETELNGVKCVLIETISDFTVTGAIERMGNSFTVDGKGKTTSTTYFDHKNFVMLKRESKVNQETNISVPAMGGDIIQTSESKSTVELVK